jgi:TonB family protein
MYGQWNRTAARQLKRAYLTVNVLEAMIVGALMVAIQLGTRVPPVVIPNPDIPVINLPYVDLHNPPSIVSDPIEIPVFDPPAQVVTNGIPVPVPDADATDNTLGTQNQLNGVNPLDPRLKNDPGVIVRIVPDTMPQPAVDTGNADIPEPGKFVKTSRKPEVVRLQAPEYPDHCRILGIEGVATVNLLLNRNGSIMDARVARSSGNAELDSAAVKAGRKCEFTPALGNRLQPVRVWVAVPFSFKLER